MNRALIVGGNENYFDYPNHNVISGFDIWGNALWTNGVSVKYVDNRSIRKYQNELLEFSPDLVVFTTYLFPKDSEYEMCFLYDVFPDAKFVAVVEGLDMQLSTFSYGKAAIDYWNSIKRANLVLVPSSRLLERVKCFDVGDVRLLWTPCNIDLLKSLYKPTGEGLVYHGANYHESREIFLSVKLAELTGYSSILCAEKGKYDDVLISLDSFFNNVELVKTMSVERFVSNVLSRCRITSFITSNQTQGRIAAESAILGIAHVGTPHRWTEVFYPNTMTDWVNVSETKKIFEKLKNKTFYDDVVGYASERVGEHLTCFNAGKRMLEILT